jgi:hypothetical protein
LGGITVNFKVRKCCVQEEGLVDPNARCIVEVIDEPHQVLTHLFVHIYLSFGVILPGYFGIAVG